MFDIVHTTILQCKWKSSQSRKASGNKEFYSNTLYYVYIIVFYGKFKNIFVRYYTRVGAVA